MGGDSRSQDERIALLRPEWPASPRVRAAFTLRAGGVSRPPFHTLNVGAHVGDEPEAVRENRGRIREALELPAEPAWLTQVHEAAVVSLGEGALGVAAGEPTRADASITRVPGRVCAIQVADCLPVLLAARDGAAVGAAHCGWRGLAAGVLGASVQALGVPPPELMAWLGPAIGPAHFEVGEEVREALAARDPSAAAALTRNGRGRWQCDLYAVARGQLASLGIRAVHGGGWCTYADPARFFSYRREGRCGRMVALIWIEPGEGSIIS